MPLIGFMLQYSVMPSLAVLFARCFGLGPELTAGLILVGSALGGTASNLVTLISQADVALSVLMTAFSTVGAIVIPPFPTSHLAGTIAPINSIDLVKGCAEVVLVPVVLGVALNRKAPRLSERVSRYTPFTSMLLITLICGTISASNAGIAATTTIPTRRLLAAVASLHSGGYQLGYFFARVLGAEEKQSRTISIEKGMQNSALASVLATHFPNPILTALPGCWSASYHSCIGSLLAMLWRRNPPGGRSPKQASKRQSFLREPPNK